MRYNHFDMLPERAFLKVGGQIKPQGGGGGNANPGPTQTNVTQTNIPQYAQPYVESMLGATQQQLFNTAQRQTGTDEAGNATYTTDITGIKPYQPYSANPSDYVAGFSPLQQQAFDSIANMKVAQQLGQATGYANQATQGGMGTAAPAMGYGAMGAGLGQTAAGAGARYAQQATNAADVQAYMNPYLQASLAPQLQLVNQQFGIQNAANQAQATQQGAFGGGRQALMQGLNQQNRALATNQLVSQGYNQAFNQAQQAQQFGANLGLQGLQAGMQGVGLGLQGVQGAQNAYNLGLQGSGLLTNIGQAQHAQEMAIANAQLQAGGLQQQQQQNITNQAIQNYATAQQYPQQQLAFMNSMLRGLPLQTSTVQQYQAAPSMTSQAAGLGVAGLGAYQLMKAEGGQIKEKKFAAGGIASGVSKDKLDGMLDKLSDQQLMQKADVKQNDPDTAIAAAGQQAFRARMRNPGIGAAPATTLARMAGGGIVAFAGPEGSVVEEPKDQETRVSSEDIAAVTPVSGTVSSAGAKAGPVSLADYYAQQKSMLPEFTAGKDYLRTLAGIRGDVAANKQEAGAMRFIQAGLGILGGPSPYAGVNIGKGAEPAVAGAIQDIKEQRKEQMELAKAEYDVGSAEYKVAAEIAKGASENYNKELDRLMHLGMSETQANATIQAARIHAGATRDAAKAKAEADKVNAATIAKQYIDGKTAEIVAANPGMSTVAARNQATEMYYAATHPQQPSAALSTAETAALAGDKDLKALYIDRIQQDFGSPKWVEVDAKIKQREAEVLNRVRGSASPRTGASTQSSGGSAPPPPAGFVPVNP